LKASQLDSLQEDGEDDEAHPSVPSGRWGMDGSVGAMVVCEVSFSLWCGSFRGVEERMEGREEWGRRSASWGCCGPEEKVIEGDGGWRCGTALMLLSCTRKMIGSHVTLRRKSVPALLGCFVMGWRKEEGGQERKVKGPREREVQVSC
jgi:hypothetical protein